MTPIQPEALRIAKLLNSHAKTGILTNCDEEREAATELLRLHAENEALRASRGQAPTNSALELGADELAQDELAQDELAQDAARYRWLRERSSTMFVNISINGEGAEIAETLDSAVDAARKQGEKE